LDPATIALADVLTPNQAELALLAAAPGAGAGAAELAGACVPAEGAPGIETLARRLLVEGAGGRAVVVTLGAAGALVVLKDGPAALAIPASHVVPVDTTGAGDAFNGALAAGLAAGLPLSEAARRAVAAAGLSTTRAGARSGMPTAAELAAFRGG
jgi:ribokinase